MDAKRRQIRKAHNLIDFALAEINRACKQDEIVNHSRPLGRAIEYATAARLLLKSALGQEAAR